MLRFDLVCPEPHLPEAGLCSRRVLEAKGWKVPILPGMITEGRAWDGLAAASRLGTERRNWLWGAATPAKHSKLCPSPKADPVAAPFRKAELAAPRWPAPGCCCGFCS